MTPRAVAQLGGPPLAVLAAWFGVGWLPPRLSGDADRLTRVEAERDALVAEVVAARTLPAEAGPAEQRLAAAVAAVPAEAEVSEFVQMVGQQAAARGVTVDQISPLAASSDSDPEASARMPAGTSSITLSIGTRGAYEALMGFLDDLRHQPRLVIVDLIDLRTDENDAASLVGDLEVRIFTTQELVRPPTVDDPAIAVADDAVAGTDAPGGGGELEASQ